MKIPSTENPELSNVLSFETEAGQIVLLHAPPAARSSAFAVHSASLSRILLKHWATYGVDSELHFYVLSDDLPRCDLRDGLCVKYRCQTIIIMDRNNGGK